MIVARASCLIHITYHPTTYSVTSSKSNIYALQRHILVKAIYTHLQRQILVKAVYMLCYGEADWSQLLHILPLCTYLMSHLRHQFPRYNSCSSLLFSTYDISSNHLQCHVLVKAIYMHLQRHVLLEAIYVVLRRGKHKLPLYTYLMPNY